MTKIIWLLLISSGAFLVNAQTADKLQSAPAAVAVTADAERLRISAEKAKLEAGFDLESAACYQKFLVSNCLNDIQRKRRDALADLRRQEIALNTLERKAKAAEQVRKTEEKSSPENQQRDAEKRADALRDFQVRMDRERQKNAARADTQANQPGNSQALAERIKGQQEKAIARDIKQAAAAGEVRKFNERQEKAMQRQAQRDRDLLNQNKPAQPLPVSQ